MVANMGTYLIAGITIVLAMVVVWVMTIFKGDMIKRLVKALEKKLFFNSILRVGIQSYLRFSLLSFASMATISFDDKNTSINSVIGILMLTFVIAYPLFVWKFLSKNKLTLSNPAKRQRFDSLYQNLDVYTNTSLLLMPFFLFRRLLIGVIVTFLKDYPYF